MSEQLVKITKNTLIPIGLVLSIVSASIFITSKWTGLVKNVEANTSAIQDTVSSKEFNNLQKTVEEIRLDVKTLLKEEKN